MSRMLGSIEINIFFYHISTLVKGVNNNILSLIKT